MTAPLFDTHAHIQLREFERDASAVLERARSAGLTGMLVLGVDSTTSEAALALALEHEDVHAAAGYHPHDAKDLATESWETIGHLAHQPEVVAIGEIGLDFYRDLSPRDVQIPVLERQLELAREVSKPVAVHCREANETLFPILESWSLAMGGSLSDGRAVGVMHYFSGDVSDAERYADLGFLISVHTSVTHPNSEQLRCVAAEMPLETLVVETDSPYGAPQSLRGKRNEPANVKEAVAKVAEVRGTTFESVAAATTANAQRLFVPIAEPAGARGGAR
jgi:TatD DNase family protein